MRCNLCGSTTFRLSRLRVSDLPRMAIFQYPVRCRNCYKRTFTSLLFALKVGYEDRLRHQSKHGKSNAAPGRA
jgi:hypothetical protein